MDLVTILIVFFFFLLLLGTIVAGPYLVYLVFSSFWRRKRARKGFALFISTIEGWHSTDRDSSTLETPTHKIQASILSSGDPGVASYQIRHDSAHIVRIPSPFQDQDPRLMLAVSCNHPVEFSINHETLLDKLAKKSGLSVEPQTNNPSFDPRCYVSCSDAQFIVNYLTPQRQSAVLKLFDLGFRQITYFSGQLSLYSTAQFLKERSGLNQAKAIIGEFVSLASSEPITNSQIPRAEPGLPDHWLPDILGCAILTTILIFGYSRAIAHETLLMRDSAVMALVTSVVYFLYLRAKNGASSTFHRRIMVHIPVCLIASYTIAYFGTSAINCTFDSSTPREVSGVFVTITHSRFGKLGSYRPFAELSFASDSGERVRTRLQVSDERALAIHGRERSMAKIYLREGFLGYQWVSNFKIE